MQLVLLVLDCTPKSRRCQMAVPKPKYPLAIPVKAGLDIIERLELRAETSLSDNVNDYRDYSSVLFSAHAPTSVGDERLNIAATDDEFRDLSISVFKDYLDRCGSFPNIKQLNLHFGLKYWVSESQTRGQIGDYQRHVEAVRTIADYAKKYGIEIVMENLNSYWSANGISDQTPEYEVEWIGKNEAFGMHPEEWIKMCLDIDRENVRLCLDSSHVSTYAHRFAADIRETKISTFLSQPGLISHVHWSDNYLYDVRGRQDSHLSVGRGTIPTEFHKRIKRLDATILLEHFYTLDELEEELEFIDKL